MQRSVCPLLHALLHSLGRCTSVSGFIIGTDLSPHLFASPLISTRLTFRLLQPFQRLQTSVSVVLLVFSFFYTTRRVELKRETCLPTRNAKYDGAMTEINLLQVSKSLDSPILEYGNGNSRGIPAAFGKSSVGSVSFIAVAAFVFFCCFVYLPALLQTVRWKHR